MRPDILTVKPDLTENFTRPELTDALWTILGQPYDDYASNDWGVVRADQVAVRDKRLVLSMDKRQTPRVFKGDRNQRERWWDVAKVWTREAFAFEHGAIEIVAKVPCAPLTSAGVWPALWLRPLDGSIGGEIDFMESFGDLGEGTRAKVAYPERYTATVHFDQTNRNRDEALSPASPVKLSEGFHRYGLLKTSEEIIFYLDRQEIHRVTRKGNESRWDVAFPPGAKYHLIMNIQAGSSWWGLPTDDTPDHSEMVVDSVTGWIFD